MEAKREITRNSGLIQQINIQVICILWRVPSIMNGNYIHTLGYITMIFQKIRNKKNIKLPKTRNRIRIRTLKQDWSSQQQYWKQEEKFRRKFSISSTLVQLNVRIIFQACKISNIYFSNTLFLKNLSKNMLPKKERISLKKKRKKGRPKIEVSTKDKGSK